jgi:hypothetical protein
MVMTNTPFEHVLIEEMIPFIDANFRTIADQPHRALSGLSIGEPAAFSYYGVEGSSGETTGRQKTPRRAVRRPGLCFLPAGWRFLQTIESKLSRFGIPAQARLVAVYAWSATRARIVLWSSGFDVG